MGEYAAPLSGMLVLDLSRLLPGPYCAWLLRSWGARVVKVEELAVGDYLREAQPHWFAQLNAGAESVALDLKHPAGRTAFLRLASKADVVLESFRPGVLERLGLSFSALQAENPRLVLVSLSGYGSGSGMADRAGHDLTYLARSGLLSLMREVPPMPIADLTAGMIAAGAALAAVLGARTTGRGSHVETALFDAAGALGLLLAADVRATGDEPLREQMPLAGGLGCYDVYDTADGGRVALGALEPKFWRAFCVAVQRPDWMERHMDPSLRGELAALFASQPLGWWGELAECWPDACLEPVRSMTQAARENANVQPAVFDGVRPAAVGRAPARGEHTQEFLRAAGFAEQEIRLLAAEGVILLQEPSG